MNTTRDLLKIGLVANIFEWYEFGIYAYLADIVGQLFFGAGDAISRLMLGFAVFAVGYLARLLGSLFFGMLGDRIGRGRPLKIALIMMAAPTICIGLLPTYHHAGLLAPVLLLILRLMQGFAMGGELPLNGCYIFEASAADRKSILCSVVMVSIALGMLSASLVAALLFWCFDRPTILAWAWRLPFLLGLPLTIAIGAMRRAIHDLPTPQAELLANQRAPAFSALKQPLLKAIALMSFTTVFSFILTIWMPSYLVHFLHYPPALARLSNTLTLTALIAFKLAGGYIAYLLSYQRLIKIGIMATLLSILPLWFGLGQATSLLSFGAVLTMQLILALLAASVSGVIMEALARQFPPFVRCRGMNLAYTFPTVFLGSATPLILTWIINRTGWLMFPAFYLLFFALLALPAVFAFKRQEAGCAKKAEGLRTC